MKEGNDVSGLKPSAEPSALEVGDFVDVLVNVYDKAKGERADIWLTGGYIDSFTNGLAGEDFDRINVHTGFQMFGACHPNCVRKAKPAERSDAEQTPLGNLDVTGEERKIG